jgi:hypothetical protein
MPRKWQCARVNRERATRLLARHAEQERQRDTHLMTRLQNGEQLDSSEVLGCSLDPDTAVYPAGLILDDFLPLALAISANVCIRVPSLFTLAEFEETLGVSYPDLLNLVDRGLVTPILNDYDLYEDVEIVAPIVNQQRPHLTEQRVMLNLLSGSDNAWTRLVLGLEQAQGLFPSTTLRTKDLGDDVQFQGIHVAYATLCALGYGDRIIEVVAAYQHSPNSDLFGAIRRLLQNESPSLEEVGFVLTTFLAGFFADCVGLGATGQFDLTYEQVLRIPAGLADSVTFLPTAFGNRLVDWLDLSLPRRLETRDLDDMLDSDARAAVSDAMARFKQRVETGAFTTAVAESQAIQDGLKELDRGYRRMTSIERYGAVLSSVSFAAVPLTLAAGMGLTEAIAGGMASAATKAVLENLAQNDVLARHVFNPALSRFGPRGIDATTYQLCRLRASATTS